MRKSLLAGLVVAASLGAAQGTGESISVGNTSTNGQQTIILTIPQKAALHIIGTTWNLNLNNPVAGADPYTIGSNPNPNNPPLPSFQQGQNWGCWLVPKAVNGNPINTPAALAALAQANYAFQPVAAYPAILPTAMDNGVVTDEEKGSLICIFKKKMQLWWNANTGYRLTATAGPTGGGSFPTNVGKFAITGGAPFTSFASPNVSPFSNLVYSQPSGTSNGWDDIHVYEAFWFDGTEVAQNSTSITVNFTLAQF